jgi:hypothetical protein
MERVQLFKRLHDMTMDDLYQFIKPTESIKDALFKLDMAARTRHVIHAIQIEDLWQSKPEGSDVFNLYLCMKLSPMTLESCIDLNDGMNSLEWRFVLPKYQDLPDDQKPANFGDYLGKMKNVEILDIEECDIDHACDFLDKAYDFSHHKKKPIVPRQQGGANW